MSLKPEASLRASGYISTGEAAAMLGMKQGSNVDRLLAKNKVPVVEIPMGAKKRRMWLRDSVAVLAQIKHPAPVEQVPTEQPAKSSEQGSKPSEHEDHRELQRMQSEIAGLSARVAHLEALLMVHRKPDRQLRLA